MGTGDDDLQSAEQDAGASTDGTTTTKTAEKPNRLIKSAPMTRKHVSAVELEARFDSWRDDRRTKKDERTPEDESRAIRRGLGLAMGAGVIALVIASSVTGSGFEKTQAANTEQITTLETDLESAKAVPEDVDVAGKLTALSEAAAKDGGRVATLQQEFAKLNNTASTAKSPGNGAPSSAMLDAAEHRKKLAPLFSPRSYLVDDEKAYQWTSLDPFDTSIEIDPRFAWYTRYDGEVASSPNAYTWDIETVMPDLDSQDALGLTNKAQVVWLNKDTKTGQTLAWASATYTYDADAKTGVFSGLELTITAAGAEHQHAGQPSSEVAETSGKKEES